MPPERQPDELEEHGSTIVLLGRFNPRIFQPLWFAARGLVTDSDVDPESVVLTDGFAAFSTPLISVFCSQDRCQFGTTETTPTPDVVRDLAIGTFELLRETPVWEFGLNHMAHLTRQGQHLDEIATLSVTPKNRWTCSAGSNCETVEFVADRDDKFARRSTR